MPISVNHPLRRMFNELVARELPVDTCAVPSEMPLCRTVDANSA